MEMKYDRRNTVRVYSGDGYTEEVDTDLWFGKKLKKLTISYFPQDDKHFAGSGTLFIEGEKTGKTFNTIEMNGNFLVAWQSVVHQRRIKLYDKMVAIIDMTKHEAVFEDYDKAGGDKGKG